MRRGETRNAVFAIGPVRQVGGSDEAWGIDSYEKEHPLFCAAGVARAGSD